jgi:predicted nucleic acid-binding protein
VSPTPWLILFLLFLLIKLFFLKEKFGYEYMEVLPRELSEARWQKIQPILGMLLAQAEFVTIYYSWRPISPDPGDDHVIDCAMNASAPVVTSNVRDFRQAAQALGLQVITPVEFVTWLADEPNTE